MRNKWRRILPALVLTLALCLALAGTASASVANETNKYVLGSETQDFVYDGFTCSAATSRTTDWLANHAGCTNVAGANDQGRTTGYEHNLLYYFNRGNTVTLNKSHTNAASVNDYGSNGVAGTVSLTSAASSTVNLHSYELGSFSYPILVGNGATLTINDSGTAYVKGTGSGNLIVNAGTIYIEGTFKTVTVNGGYVTDFGAVTITNNEGTALTVTGGSASLREEGGKINATGQSQFYGIDVSGGKLTMEGYDVTVNCTSSNSYGAYVHSGGTFDLKSGSITTSGAAYLRAVNVRGDNGTYSYFYLGVPGNGASEGPHLKSAGTGGFAINADTYGVATLYSGDVYGQGDGARAVSVQSNGKANIYPGTKYGEGVSAEHLIDLYVDDANGQASMYVEQGGRFEIRGRGATFYRILGASSQYRINPNTEKTVLYVYQTADTADTYPLSGGTFVGSVEVADGTIDQMLLYNHYVRKDSIAMNWFGYTNGTAGLVPGADKDYTNILTGIHSVTDAEWELRQVMGVDNGDAPNSYQIPQGIVRNADEIVLDFNARAENSWIWGVGMIQGDVDIDEGENLYLGGRKICYTGKNSVEESIASLIGDDNTDYSETDINDVTYDAYHVLYVNNTCAISDVAGLAPSQTKNAGDTLTGMGGVYYTLKNNDRMTCAIYNYDDLTLYSGRFESAVGKLGVGVYQEDHSALLTGRNAAADGTEDKTPGATLNNDRLVILGGQHSGAADTRNDSYGVDVHGGDLTINAARIGDTGAGFSGGDTGIGDFGGDTGVRFDGNDSDVLTVNGGFISGNFENGCGLNMVAGTGYIFGGYIQGDASTMEIVDGACDYTRSGNYGTRGTAVIVGNNDAAKAPVLYLAEKTGFESVSLDSAAYPFYIGDVDVHATGGLAVGKTKLFTDEVNVNSVIFGSLTVDGAVSYSGGRVKFFGGEVLEDVLVTGYAKAEFYGGVFCYGYEDYNDFIVSGNADVDFYGGYDAERPTQYDDSDEKQTDDNDYMLHPAVAQNTDYATVLGDVTVSDQATFNVGDSEMGIMPTGIGFNYGSREWTSQFALFDGSFTAIGGLTELTDATVNGDFKVWTAAVSSYPPDTREPLEPKEGSALVYIRDGDYADFAVYADAGIQVAAVATRFNNAYMSRNVQLHGGSYDSIAMYDATESDHDNDAETSDTYALSDDFVVGDIIPWKVINDSRYEFDGIEYGGTGRYNHYVSSYDGVGIGYLSDSQLDSLHELTGGENTFYTVHDAAQELAAALNSGEDTDYTLRCHIALDRILENSVTLGGSDPADAAPVYLCDGHFFCGGDQSTVILIESGEHNLYLNGFDLFGSRAGGDYYGLINVDGGILNIYDTDGSSTASVGGRIFNAYYAEDVEEKEITGCAVQIDWNGVVNLYGGTLRGVGAGVEMYGDECVFNGLGGTLAGTWTNTGKLGDDYGWTTDGNGLYTAQNTGSWRYFNNGNGLYICYGTANLSGSYVYGRQVGVYADGNELNVTGGTIDAGTVANVLAGSRFLASGNSIDSNVTLCQPMNFDSYPASVRALTGGIGIHMDYYEQVVHISGGKISGTMGGLWLDGGTLDVSNANAIVSPTVKGGSFGILQTDGEVSGITGGTIEATNGAGFWRTDSYEGNLHFIGIAPGETKGATFSGLRTEVEDETLEDLLALREELFSSTDRAYLTFKSTNGIEVGSGIRAKNELKNGTQTDGTTFATVLTEGSEAITPVTVGTALANNFTVVPRTYYEIAVYTGAHGEIMTEDVAWIYEPAKTIDETLAPYTIYVVDGMTPVVTVTPDEDYATKRVVFDRQIGDSTESSSRMGAAENKTEAIEVTAPVPVTFDTIFGVAFSEARTVTAGKGGHGSVTAAYVTGTEVPYNALFGTPDPITLTWTPATATDSMQTASFVLADGNSAQFTFTPDEGHSLKDVRDGLDTQDAAIAAKSYVLAANADESVTGFFTQSAAISVTTTASLGGTVNYLSENITASFGDAKTVYPTYGTSAAFAITAKDAENDHIVSVTVDGVKYTAAQIMGTQEAPATAAPVYSGANDGFAVVSAGKHETYLHQANFTFSNVTVDHTISAEFAADVTYTVTPSAGTGATITPTAVETVKGGTDSAEYTVGAASGYTAGTPTVQKWNGTTWVAATLDTDYTLTGSMVKITSLTENYRIIANATGNSVGGGGGSFATTYTITATAGAGGTITPNGSTSIDEGGSQIYTVTPNDGFAVEDVTVNGTSVGAQTAYTFSNIGTNATIHATFKAESSDRGFIDVPEGAWYYEDVYALADRGIMDGITATTFKPADLANRAMIAVMLWRMSGEPAAPATDAFTDVADEMWYSEAIAWASANKIVEGYPNGTFLPLKQVSRQELAVLLMRYASFRQLDVTARGSLAAFPDGASCPAWSLEAVQWAVAKDILQGRSEGPLDLFGNAKRCEVAALFNRFIEKLGL